MNRREFVIGARCLAVGAAAIETNPPLLHLARVERTLFRGPDVVDKLPRKVACIALVDSPIAKAATSLCRAESPPYLFNHAARTYLFGFLIGNALTLKFDREVLSWLAFFRISA